VEEQDVVRSKPDRAVVVFDRAIVLSHVVVGERAAFDGGDEFRLQPECLAEVGNCVFVVPLSIISSATGGK
jgi:hypothetical protein